MLVSEFKLAHRSAMGLRSLISFFTGELVGSRKQFSTTLLPPHPTTYNCISEFMGLNFGKYEAKCRPMVTGSWSFPSTDLHKRYLTEGPAEASIEYQLGRLRSTSRVTLIHQFLAWRCNFAFDDDTTWTRFLGLRTSIQRKFGTTP